VTGAGAATGVEVEVEFDTKGSLDSAPLQIPMAVHSHNSPSPSMEAVKRPRITQLEGSDCPSCVFAPAVVVHKGRIVAAVRGCRTSLDPLMRTACKLVPDSYFPALGGPETRNRSLQTASLPFSAETKQKVTEKAKKRTRGKGGIEPSRLREDSGESAVLVEEWSEIEWQDGISVSSSQRRQPQPKKKKTKRNSGRESNARCQASVLTL